MLWLLSFMTDSGETLHLSKLVQSGAGKGPSPLEESLLSSSHSVPVNQAPSWFKGKCPRQQLQ